MPPPVHPQPPSPRFDLGRLVLLLVGTYPTLAHAQLPTPAAVAAKIKAHGAKAVVARLNVAPVPPNTHNGWDLLVGQIHLGRPAYIRLAPKLAPGTDAGTSEDLGIALAFALPIAPADVLGVIDLQSQSPLAVSRVCGAPFIEDTVRDLPAYLRKAHTAVQSVASPGLSPAKTACLDQLDAVPQHR